MSIVLDDLTARLDTLTKAVLSQPLARIGCSRVTIRPLSLRGKAFFQLEYQHGQKVTHRNVTKGELPGLFAQELDGLYLQAVLCTETETRQYIRKTNGSYKCTAKGEAQRTAAPKAHDRRKEYILAEGENIPALVDLGVFTPDLRIVKAKYDKYKQINRFIELVDDAFRASEQQEITILDFGCGKSYLTFILYYYFTVKRGVKATILGYDLKEDVVEHCNAIAQKYGYDGLRFVVSDVTRDTLADTHVDMVVTLHACDTATDYALWYAVEKGVKHIFSVPCCQHEINATIHKGGDFDVLLRPRSFAGALFRAADRFHPRRRARGHGLHGGRDRIHRLRPLAEKPHAPLRQGPPRGREEPFRRVGACRKIRLPPGASGACGEKMSQCAKHRLLSGVFSS